LHDYDGGRGGSNGHHRVHDNAELAVIGVRLVRVQVRDLSHGQHRQQNQTENGHCRQKAGQEARQKARLGAAFAAENCLKSCQSMEPSSSILQKALRGLDAFGLERLPFGNDFEAAHGKTLARWKRLN
jgi:hypothetical protein